MRFYVKYEFNRRGNVETFIDAVDKLQVISIVKGMFPGSVIKYMTVVPEVDLFDESELPGMWEAADFIGGETD